MADVTSAVANLNVILFLTVTVLSLHLGCLNERFVFEVAIQHIRSLMKLMIPVVR